MASYRIKKNRIKEIRLSKGKKAVDVMRAMGWARSTYRRYEENQSQPDEQRLIILANYFDVSVEDLIVEYGNMPINKSKSKADVTKVSNKYDLIKLTRAESALAYKKYIKSFDKNQAQQFREKMLELYLADDIKNIRKEIIRIILKLNIKLTFLEVVSSNESDKDIYFAFINNFVEN